MIVAVYTVSPFSVRDVQSADLAFASARGFRRRSLDSRLLVWLRVVGKGPDVTLCLSFRQ
jgi:hypothetical protein